MLDSNTLQQLQTYLAKLQRPIELHASLDDSDASLKMRELLDDIASASPLVSVRAATLVRKPSFGVAAAGQAPRVVFAGLPLGHEFTSLVLALLWAGGHPPKQEDALIEQAKALSGPMQFDVYVSLSCHNCPDVVQSLVLLATVNPRVEVCVIDGAGFQAEVEQRNIMAVPAVFRDGQHFASGRMELQELLSKLDTSSIASQAAELTSKQPYDVLVVGGGPAGAAAAVYAARKGIRTGMLAERFGGQTNDTMGIENYISVLETTGPRFAADLQAHVRHYGVDMMGMQRASKLVATGKVGELIEVHTESGAVLKARSVVLSTGARWRNVGVPGEQEYKNKGVAYCPHCDGPLFKGKRTAVIGGGNSGVEAAIDLAGIVAHVTLLEYGNELRADAVLVDKLKSLPNVTIVTQAQTTEIVGDGRRVTSLRYRDRATEREHVVELEGIFVQIGLVPNTEFLRGAVELNRFGEILVDAKCHTSVPGVFAAGDATNVPYKQIVIAAGEGAKAALSAFDHLIRTPEAG